LDAHRGPRLSHEVWGECPAHAGNQEDGRVQFATAMGRETLFRLAHQRFDDSPCAQQGAVTRLHDGPIVLPRVADLVPQG